MRHALWVGREPFVVGPFGVPEHGAAAGELRVVAHGEDEMAVGGRSRRARAARMATVAYRPVITSVNATPAFSGPQPGSPWGVPVMLISPPRPWIKGV
jgi:hypothetical protein